MAKQRNRTADFAVYLIIRLAAAFLRAVPFPAANRLANALALVMMAISRRRIQVARENLKLAFPGQFRDHEIDRLVVGMYRHFCRVIVEIIYMDRLLRLDNWRDHFAFKSIEHYRRFNATALSDRPVMMVTAHFGNWELTGRILGMLGFKGYVIARPLDNVYLDRWMHRWRESTGQRVINKNGEFELIEEALRSHRILGTVGDQDAGQRGIFVPFFNRPASTHKAIALLGLEHNALILVGGAARVGSGFNYRCHIEDVIDPLEYSGCTDAVPAITRRFTEALERMIRQYPEQYLWIHRRWKHQPQPSRKKSAA